MSGFFMIRSDIVARILRPGLSAIGFKILLDLLTASAPTASLRRIALHVPSAGPKVRASSTTSSRWNI